MEAPSGLQAGMRVKLVKCPGLAEVTLEDDATLHSLLQAIAASQGVDAAQISLLCRGKQLAIARGAEPLTSLGVVDGATAIVMVRRAAETAKVNAALEDVTSRQQALEKAEKAAALIAARMDGTADVGDGEMTSLELYNQRGQRIELPRTDQRGLALGCLLHAKAKVLLSRAQRRVVLGEAIDGEGGGSASTAADLADAVALLNASHAAFSAVDPKFQALGDNVANACVDSAWAVLLLDLCAQPGPTDHAAGPPAEGFTPETLATAKERLAMAQRLLAVLHGPALEKLQTREAAADPEAAADSVGQARATYVRLRLLLGAVAVHEGRHTEGRALLTSAKGLCDSLRITPEDDTKVAQLLSLGLSPREAKRALLATGKDPERAAVHALTVREAWRAAAEAQRQRRAEEREARRFGRTASGAAVDLRALRTVAAMGFDEELAAEALRRSDNDLERTMAVLTSEEERENLELAVALRRTARDHRKATRRSCRALAPAAAEAPDVVPAGGAALLREGADGGTGRESEEAGEGGSEGNEEDKTWRTERQQRLEAEESIIDESGIVSAVKSAEEAYDTCDLSCESVAIDLYLSRLS